MTDDEHISIEITHDPLEIQHGSIGGTASGALVVFAGIVRGDTDKREVIGLQYEAYPEMADQILRDIAREAWEQGEVESIKIIHRLGELDVGEISVLVAVAAPHRGAAFDACQFCIDTLKERAPIWKKEEFADGESRWVGHP